MLNEMNMAFIATMEEVINRYLALADADVLAQLSRFRGKVIGIEFTDFNQQMYCIPNESGVILMSQFQGTADVTFKGSVISMLKLAASTKQSEVLMSGEIKIDGDIELGQQFGRFLGQLNIDWEEHLSQISGDVIAHKAGYAFREVKSWWSNNSQRFWANQREYAQQEINILPQSMEIESFYQGVDTLRDDLARVEVRVQRLRNQLKNKV